MRCLWRAPEGVTRIDYVGARRAVVEALALNRKCSEKSVDRGKLCFRRLRGVDLPAERITSREILGVPAKMLARNAGARHLAIERVMIGKMRDNRGMRLGDRWRRKANAMVEEMRDLAEDPGPALRGTADHDRIGAGFHQHARRLLRRVDVAVGDHRNADRRLDGANRSVFDGAMEGARARPAVDGERNNAGVLRDA